MLCVVCVWSQGILYKSAECSWALTSRPKAGNSIRHTTWPSTAHVTLSGAGEKDQCDGSKAAPRFKAHKRVYPHQPRHQVRTYFRARQAPASVRPDTKAVMSSTSHSSRSCFLPNIGFGALAVHRRPALWPAKKMWGAPRSYKCN